jgi:hypothetical protein
MHGIGSWVSKEDVSKREDDSKRNEDSKRNDVEKIFLISSSVKKSKSILFINF